MTPQISREKLLELIRSKNVDLDHEGVVLVGIRGYYEDSMGKLGKNDIGMFDDALIWVTKTGEKFAFCANTDPSRYYQGVATLKEGKWSYKPGKHGISRPGGGYPAFRQAAPVIVRRYQASTGTFKESVLGDTINIHKGGFRTTSSAGCQTLPPENWTEFKTKGYALLEKYGRKSFWYLLFANDGIA